MRTDKKDSSRRLITALMRSRRRRLTVVAALIAVVGFLPQTAAWSLDEARGDVLYVGAASVSYPSARDAGLASRAYLGEVPRETMLALGFTRGETYIQDAHRALASISEPPGEEAAYPTLEAAIRAGDKYLVQAGSTMWGEPGYPLEDSEGEQFAASDTERVRPELGDGRIAPDDNEENAPTTGADTGSESGADSPQFEDAEHSPADEKPEYASVEPYIVEPDAPEANVAETSIAEPDILETRSMTAVEPTEPDPTPEEPTPDETIPDEEVLSAPPVPVEDAVGEEFASLPMPRPASEETLETPPDHEEVLSEEVSPTHTVAPMSEESMAEGAVSESAPVEQSLTHGSHEYPQAHPPSTPAGSPPENSPDEPGATSPGTLDDQWAAASTHTSSVEVAVNAAPIRIRPEPVEELPEPPSSVQPHGLPAPPPHRPRPESPPPTEPTSDSPASSSPIPSNEDEPSENESAPGGNPGDEESESGPPSAAAPETPEEGGQPAPTNEPEEEPPNMPESNGEPNADSEPAGNPQSLAQSPNHDGGSPDVPEQDEEEQNGGVPVESVEPSIRERQFLSQSGMDSDGSSQVSRRDQRRGMLSIAPVVPDVDRAMIRVRPAVSDEHAGYEVERILPGGVVEPIYEGNIGFEEAVTVGVNAGGVPPMESQPTSAAFDEAAVELALYQSGGQGAPASEFGGVASPEVAPPVVGGQPEPTAGDAAWTPTETWPIIQPADVNEGVGDPNGYAEPRAIQDAAVTPTAGLAATVPGDAVYPREQAVPGSSSTTQAAAYGQTIPEPAVLDPTVAEGTLYAQPPVSGAVDGEQPVIEPSVPYQPPVAAFSESESLTGNAQFQRIQISSQPIQDAQPITEVPAPTPQSTGGMVQSQITVQQTAAQSAAALDARTSTPTNAPTSQSVPTNIQTSQSIARGSVQSVTSNGG